ncbi:hypothetical protein [Streptacidiphilus melanogenes]|uniref:hypothetical protein n=1 Tax=Streptacidiphilus melanogenes TaxID=411235 RepID=UPI0006941BD3|nr:hypothetical protein [Streptacidiphilus melanogenes]
MARTTKGLVIGGLLGATVLALAGCGADRGSSVALDDAPAPAATTPSQGGVVFVPLDPHTSTRASSAPGPADATGTKGGADTSGTPGAPASTPGTPGAGGGTGGGGGTGTGSGTGAGSGGTPSSPPAQGGGHGGTGGSTGGGATGGTGTPPPQTPASLAVTALQTADTAQRWCQKVTLTLANSGDRAATGGTVTFATHVIGALGVDWWTYRTSQPLAAPVAGHASADESWTICLDAWRVPLGMHLETRAATLG